jgi:hypothetical protein
MRTRIAASAVFASMLMLCLPASGQANRFLTVTSFSYHTDRSKEQNERNLGAGIEQRLSKDVALLAGFYTNSRPGGEEVSAYGALAYTPLALGPVRAGLMLGAVTGYKAAPILPAASALFSLSGRDFGMNLHWIPPFRSSSVGTLGFQLKRAF